MIELLLAAERLLAAGELDQADRLFSQVVEADPRNAIAMTGRARVARARGDAEGAAVLARRALEIDPEDVAARRLLDEAAGRATPTVRTGIETGAAAATPAGRSLLARLRAFLGFGR
jgi:tetratricopeptide (TPR) repeat protein